ncbi:MULTISPECIES: type VI secretion protein [Pseudomonas]|uniref:type VI secretion protein n=1 Tax=Pseudomonas TaxID=286 RepID=UPI001E44A689|nr:MULTISPECIES: type VI secretion protein [Pseudomonas]MCD4530802.1 type VI secretion protein [Pseudomonas sp. C3-2018]
MSVCSWSIVLLTLVLSCSLGGCTGNYTFNDSDYRPLGDPQAVNRGSDPQELL